MKLGASLGSALTLWRFPSRLVVVVLVMLAVLVGLVWFALERSAARLVDSLRWFGQLQFDAVSTGWGGDVHVRGLRLLRYGQAAEPILEAARVRIDTPGLFWMLGLGFAPRQSAAIEAFLSPAHIAAVRGVGELPSALPPLSRLALEAEGVKLGPALADYGELRWFGPATASPFDAAGCDLERGFEEADLMRMGLPEGALTARASIERVDAVTAVVALGFGREGVSRATLTMRLRADDAERVVDGDFGALIALERHWEVVDDGFVAARNRYCASRLGITRDGFVDRHVDAVRARLALLGVRADSAVEGVYRRFAARGGELDWRSQPSLATTFRQMGRFSAAQQLRILNATIETGRGRGAPFALSIETRTDPSAPRPDGATAATAADAAPAAATDVAAADATPTAAATATVAETDTGAVPVATGPSAVAPAATAAEDAAPSAPSASGAPIGAAAAIEAVDANGTPTVPAPASVPEPAATARGPGVTSSASRSASAAPEAQRASNAAPMPPLLLRSPYAPGEVVPYAALRGMEGRRFEVLSTFGTRRRGILEKYTDAAITLRLSAREGSMRLTMPQRTVRQVRLLDQFSEDLPLSRESG